MLLLLERPHGGCQAACHFQTRIPSQAYVATRSFSEPVAGASKGQQRIKSVWGGKAHNDFSSGLIRTSSAAIQAEATPSRPGSSWAIAEAGPLVLPFAAIQSDATPAESGSGDAISAELYEAIEVFQPPIPAPTLAPVFYCMGAISEAEYQALQDLYLATGGDNWHWHNLGSSGESEWMQPDSPLQRQVGGRLLFTVQRSSRNIG